MEYQEALKKIQASKKEVKTPYLMVSFGYDRNYIFPFKEGLAFVSALENAEQVNEVYNKPSSIGELTSSIQVTPFSQSEYMAYKISNLLQISLQDARNIQNSGVSND